MLWSIIEVMLVINEDKVRSAVDRQALMKEEHFLSTASNVKNDGSSASGAYGMH